MPQKSLPIQALAELLELTTRLLHARGHAEGLFPAQWMALRYFERSAPHMRTAMELARFQRLAPGSVSRTVRTLVAKGLLQKSSRPMPGRSEQLELSSAGQEMLRRDPSLALQTALSNLSFQDQVALARALESVLRDLSEDGVAEEAS